MTTKSNQDDRSRKMRHWQAHKKAQKQSGLSRAEYCRQHQLSYHAMTYWDRRLSEPAIQETTLVPVTFTPSIRLNPALAALSTLKVILPNKIAVEVGDDFSATTLTKLLMTLERR